MLVRVAMELAVFRRGLLFAGGGDWSLWEVPLESQEKGLVSFRAAGGGAVLEDVAAAIGCALLEGDS